MIAPGLTVASRLSAPAPRASSHAAASAIVFERVYGVRLVSAPSVQSASV
jgi:hypothetical protein